MPERPGVFLAWIDHSRRGQLFARDLGLELRLIAKLRRRPLLAPLRYVLQALATLRILLRARPRVVFVQSPPIFAVVVAFLYTWTFRAPLVIDAHSTALLASWWKWSLGLQAAISRRARATVVTNAHLARRVEHWRARSLVIPDVPLELSASKRFETGGRTSVAVVASFSHDEPIGEILEAARRLPDVRFYVTGDPRRAKPRWLRDRPGNVEFTGFLPEDEYLGLLRAVDAVLVLTRREHTMQRGGCEALALGKPLITSATSLLREYFDGGTLHVDNTAEEIADAVRAAEGRKLALEAEMRELRGRRRREWLEVRPELLGLIQSADLR